MHYRAPPPEVKFCIETDIHVNFFFDQAANINKFFISKEKKNFAQIFAEYSADFRRRNFTIKKICANLRKKSAQICVKL
jgi:hypothetical protein